MFKKILTGKVYRTSKKREINRIYIPYYYNYYVYMSKRIHINNNKKQVIKTWITGQKSCTLILPLSVAKEYGLEEPSQVVEGTPEGILIKKLEL